MKENEYIIVNEAECAICGNPLPLDRIMDGITICEDCESIGEECE